jgi:hypothetical protein
MAAYLSGFVVCMINYFVVWRQLIMESLTNVLSILVLLPQIAEVYPLGECFFLSLCQQFADYLHFSLRSVADNSVANFSRKLLCFPGRAVVGVLDRRALDRIQWMTKKPFFNGGCIDQERNLLGALCRHEPLE